jgi:hypothetical protein
MDRFSILNLLVRRWLMILVLTMVVFGAAYWQNSKKEASYFGSFTVGVQTTRNYPNTDKLILQSGETQDLQLAIATTQSWIADPHYVGETLNSANVNHADLSLKDYSKVFQVVSPVAFSSTYQVQYVGKSALEVSKVFASLRTVLVNTQNEFNASKGDISIALTFTDPTVTTQSSGLPTLLIAGLLAGLIFAFVIAAVTDRQRA